MKKITLFVLALSLFAACKNDPAATPATSATPATTTITPEAQAQMVEKGRASAIAQNNRLNALITEFDAMPADFRNKPEAQQLRTMLGDISGKMQIMMQVIDPASAAAPAAGQKMAATEMATPSLPDLEDAIKSVERYGENISQGRAQLDQMAADYKK